MLVDLAQDIAHASEGAKCELEYVIHTPEQEWRNKKRGKCPVKVLRKMNSSIKLRGTSGQTVRSNF